MVVLPWDPVTKETLLNSQRIFEICFFFSNEHVSMLHRSGPHRSLFRNTFVAWINKHTRTASDVFWNYSTTIEFIDHIFELVRITLYFKYLKKKKKWINWLKQKSFVFILASYSISSKVIIFVVPESWIFCCCVIHDHILDNNSTHLPSVCRLILKFPFLPSIDIGTGSSIPEKVKRRYLER